MKTVEELKPEIIKVLGNSFDYDTFINLYKKCCFNLKLFGFMKRILSSLMIEYYDEIIKAIESADINTNNLSELILSINKDSLILKIIVMFVKKYDDELDKIFNVVSKLGAQYLWAYVYALLNVEIL